MAARQTARYGVAAIALAMVIIAGTVVSMSLATTTSQTSSSQATTSQTSSQGVTTIQLGSSSSGTSSKSSTTQGQGGSGILNIYLSDAPPSGQTLKYLLANVSSLELTYRGNIAAGTTSSTTSTSSTGTQPQNVYILTVPANVGTNVNLTGLHGQSLLLGAANMPAGSITSIVLNITGAKAFYTDGSTEQLKVVADGNMTVPIQFGVQANGSTDLAIDLTPNLAHISQGGVLTPVIHVTAVEKGQNGTTTHTVTSTVTLPPSTSTVTTTQTVTTRATVTTTVTTPTTTTQTVTSTTTLPPVTTTSTTTETSTSISTVTLSPTTNTTTTANNATTTVATTSAVPIPTSTSVSCNPDPVQVNHEAECKATVTSPIGGLAGQVSFSSDGKGTFGSVTCGDNGDNGSSSSLVCHVKYAPSATGTQTITAAFSGDTYHSTSSGTFQLSGEDKGGKGDAGGPGTALASAVGNAAPSIAPTLALGTLLVTGATAIALPKFRRSATR